ncbi:hypothetical protein JFT61_07955 [Pseudomonas fluorescens]|nr:hypothetical protein [Pseudomonas fluorescens]
MNGRPLLIALFFTGTAMAAEPSLYSYDAPPTDGFMYAVRYQQAKLACGSLPDDLEADYAKAMRLTGEASPAFKASYAQRLATLPKWSKPASPEEQALACEQSQHTLRVTVQLARQWFPGGW